MSKDGDLATAHQMDRYGATDQNLSWSHPRVLSILGIVFVCGVLLGTAGTWSFMHRHMVHRPPPLAVRLDALKQQLGLTPDQEKIVTKELDDYAKYYENIEEERSDVAQHGKQRILSVLTPEQRTRFNSMFDQIAR